jgi:hypothetical protein
LDKSVSIKFSHMLFRKILRIVVKVMKQKSFAPIKVINLITKRIANSVNGPSYKCANNKPDWEHIRIDSLGEFNSDSNIFEIDAKNDKDDGTNY